MTAAYNPPLKPSRPARPWRRPAVAVIGVCVATSVAGGAFYLVKGMLANVTPPKKMIQQVTLIVPPPPPQLEKPPEPEIKDEVRLPEAPPEPTNEPPPGSQLGLDADGAGGDSFGLIGKKGGRDLLNSDPFAWYGALLQQNITEHLMEDRRVRRTRYSVTLNLWIKADGRIERFELLGSSGDRGLDESLKTSLAQLGRFPDTPPDSLPQPLTLRITSRL